jgi:hypothetical protein
MTAHTSELTVDYQNTPRIDSIAETTLIPKKVFANHQNETIHILYARHVNHLCNE